VFRDNSKIQAHYYDPYCKDPSAIKHHLSQVEDMLATKSKELTLVLDKYDLRTEQLSELAVDLAHLRSLKNTEYSKLQKL